MSRPGLFNRHEEVRLALRFILHSWYKHKQAGALPDRNRIMFDFARYKGLSPVLDKLKTPAPRLEPKQQRK